MSDQIEEVTPTQAWQILQDDPNAALIDVRTDPEWRFVGVPDISSLGRNLIKISWQTWPDSSINHQFVKELARHVRPEQTLLFICRSGARSLHAARLAAANGFARSLNVASGFEGGIDPARHRAGPNGWKHEGLPWTQE